MAMNVLKARELPNSGGFLFYVHLDDTRLIPDPAQPKPTEGKPDTRPLVPDPNWVVERKWAASPPPGRTRTQYLADIRREMRLLCQLELQQLQAQETPVEGTPLAGEGQAL